MEGHQDHFKCIKGEIEAKKCNNIMNFQDDNNFRDFNIDPDMFCPAFKRNNKEDGRIYLCLLRVI